MEDLSAKLAGSDRTMGRKALLILPFVTIIMIMFFLYVAFPMRYWFSVNNGELCLMAGKVSWIDARIRESMERIPAEGIDLTGITGQVFESETDALSVLRSFFLNRIDEQTSQLIDVEKQLAGPYTLLLKDLKAARASGAGGLDSNISVLQGWLSIYQRKVERK